MASAMQDSFWNSPGLGGGAFGTYGYQMMLASGAVSGIESYLQGGAQSKALNTAASYQEWQAGENLRRAAVEQSALQTQTGYELEQAGSKANAIIGAQKAAYGAQDVNVNAGSAATESQAEANNASIDALTIRNNAILQAWGIQTGALQTAGQEEMTALGEQAQGQQSLILGGAQAWNTLTQVQEESERTRAYFGGH